VSWAESCPIESSVKIVSIKYFIIRQF
jgi:hypothetical protein